MVKYINFIFVGILLFVVPFGSWWYLKGGFDYRKTLLNEVSPKAVVDVADSSHIYETLHGYTSVVVLDTADNISVHLDNVHEQFDNVSHFNIVYSDSLDGLYDLIIEKLIKSAIDVDTISMVLVDTSLTIRSLYGHSQNDFKKLVEHITVVLPRKQEADIQLKTAQ